MIISRVGLLHFMYLNMHTALCKVISLARTSIIHSQESGWQTYVVAECFIFIGKVNVPDKMSI